NPAGGATERFVGVCEYIPTQSDEIKLSPGDFVSILFTYEDGWVLGRNESSGAVGLLPRNFLEKESALTAGQTAARLPTNRTASLAVKGRGTLKGASSSAASSTPQTQASVPAPVQAPPAAGGASAEKLVGICDYDPQNSDEIGLRIGHKIVILFSYEDAVGLLPRNFLDFESSAHLQGNASRTPSSRNMSLMVRDGPFANMLSPANQAPAQGSSSSSASASASYATPPPSAPSTPAAQPPAPVVQAPPPVAQPAPAPAPVQPKPVQAPVVSNPLSLRLAAAVPPPVVPALKFDDTLSSSAFIEATKLKLSEIRSARANRTRVASNMGALKLMVVGDLAIGKVVSGSYFSNRYRPV
ncbi:hypothetical protein HDU96_004629, partial [Phlyctochytrium bullatum]